MFLNTLIAKTNIKGNADTSSLSPSNNTYLPPKQTLSTTNLCSSMLRQFQSSIEKEGRDLDTDRLESHVEGKEKTTTTEHVDEPGPEKHAVLRLVRSKIY